MAINWSLIEREKCYGTLQPLCCLTVEQMWLLLNRLRHADLSEVQEFHRYVCACGTNAGGNGGGGGALPPGPNNNVPGGNGNGGQNPPIPSQCTGANCKCDETAAKICADKELRGKLSKNLLGIKLAITAAYGTLGAAALPLYLTMKDYHDAVERIIASCDKGKLTPDDIKYVCANAKLAKSAASNIPGMTYLFEKVEENIKPLVESCCSGVEIVQQESDPTKVADHSYKAPTWTAADLDKKTASAGASGISLGASGCPCKNKTVAQSMIDRLY